VSLNALTHGISSTRLVVSGERSTDWDTYRREVRRLLAEGKEAQFVLIKGQQVIGLYATEREALGHGYRMFPCQAFLVHQVQEREPLLRCVSVRLCRS